MNAGAAHLGERHFRALRLFLGVLLVLSAAQFLWELPGRFRDTKLDLSAYYAAGTRVREGRVDLIYDWTAIPPIPGYGYIVQPYIYPPPLAVVFAVFSRADFRVVSGAWFAAKLAAFVGTFFILARAAGIRFVGANWVPLVVTAILFLRLPAVIHDLSMGNLNLLLAMLLAGALLLTVRGRDGAAGGLIGIAAAVKITPAFLLLYYVVARQWRALAGFGVAFVVVIGLTAGVVGWRPFVEFVRTSSAWNQATSTELNQSLKGFLHRVAEGGSDRDPAATAGSPVILVMWVIASAAIAGVSGWAIWRRGKDAFYGFGVLLLALAVISPVTWQAQLSLLLIPLAWIAMRVLCVPMSEEGAPSVQMRAGVLAILCATILIYQPNAGWVWPTGVFGIVMQSRVFLGVVMLWGIVAGLPFWDEVRRGAEASRGS